MATLLNGAEIQAQLTSLSNWEQDGNTIKTVKTFDGFPSAIVFINQLVEPAESAGHHPDITISYNKVTLSLTTHDAGGLTQQDFAMAARIDQML
ncbi:MAG: 4a-hydroxytetrahydrobiopterin dehydratase [Cyanobacteria bacterium J06626_4]